MTDHSQFQEFFRCIAPFFERNPPESRWCVDVGAYGKSMSNVYDLVCEHSFNAVLIEPHEETLKQVRSDYARFGDMVEIVDCAIGDPEQWPTIEDVEKETTYDQLYIHSVPGHHSLEPNIVPRTLTPQRQLVRIERLANVLNVTECPMSFDFLSMDTNGTDEPIVLDLLENSKYRPRLLMLEYGLGRTRGVDQLNGELAPHGYEYVWHNSVNAAWKIKGSN